MELSSVAFVPFLFLPSFVPSFLPSFSTPSLSSLISPSLSLSRIVSENVCLAEVNKKGSSVFEKQSQIMKALEKAKISRFRMSS